jgi:tetratricopeptide (TPR) repeat protein
MHMRAQLERPTDLVDSDLPWDVMDPVRSEIRLGRLKDELSRDPQQRARTIEVTTQLARAQSLQGKLVEAERTIEEAERYLPTVTELVPKLRVLLERGRLLALRRTPAEARNRFFEVWKLATESGEAFFAIDAAQMLSVIETPKKRGEWTLRALDLAENSKDKRVRSWCGPLHVELGWHFAELLQLPRALECFDTAVDRYKSEGSSRQASMARCWGARILRLMNRFEEALAIQQEVQHELKLLGAADGFVFEEIGECLRALKRTPEAETYFKRAYDVLSADEWIVNNDSARVKRLKTLGNVKNS